jgi:hypothetical protein
LAQIRRKHNVLEDAAELLRLLAAVEHAYLLDDEQALITLLDQVTPTACKGVAEELDSLAFSSRVAHSATRRELLTAVQGFPPPPPAEDAGARTSPSSQGLAPVIPLDRHSRRV